jgi:adenylate cyclase
MADVGLDGTAILSALRAQLRGVGVRQVRITSGLIMFFYLASHFANHALGNVSYEAMEFWFRYHIWWWRNPLINALLYGAATVHFSLGLWALYQRRHFRFRAAELTQLLLGLSIPVWIVAHLADARLSGVLFGRPAPSYATVLYNYWNVRPFMEWIQFSLLIAAWTHACIGLYFWLRLKRFFRWAGPFLLAGAVLLPTLAIIGVIHSARTVTELAKVPQWRAARVRPIPPDQRITLDRIAIYFPFGYLSLIGLVFVARGGRSLYERRAGTVGVWFPARQVRVPRGLSVLEASLRFNIPHASVCGGRARCSTCRVRVVSDPSVLPPPSRREAFVLARIGASRDPSIRLACQLRPKSDVAVIPILSPHVGAEFVRAHQRANIGEERYIVSMFVDMRGSTKLGEGRLPFDIVFLINRFVEAASQAVTDAGGRPNQFVGDGVLALFGLDTDPATASRQALHAAALVAVNVGYLNHQFATEVPAPIDYGIGIHAGDVIIGDVGFRGHTVFTALGDSVNVAARLQDMTKTLNCKLVVSEEVCKAAAVPGDALSAADINIRGHDAPISVRTVKDPTVLASLLETSAAPVLIEPLVAGHC